MPGARLDRALAAGSGVSLDEPTQRPPDLALGAQVYRASCAGCHGDLGRGDGKLARVWIRPPANLADLGCAQRAIAARLPANQIGVVATAMPALRTGSPAWQWASPPHATPVEGEGEKEQREGGNRWGKRGGERERRGEGEGSRERGREGERGKIIGGKENSIWLGMGEAWEPCDAPHGAHGGPGRRPGP